MNIVGGAGSRRQESDPSSSPRGGLARMPYAQTETRDHRSLIQRTEAGRAGNRGRHGSTDILAAAVDAPPWVERLLR